jgi:hypothetical protein
MKKLKFLFTLLVLLVATSASAEGMKYVVFDLRDGTQTVIALQDKPVITCQSGELKVTVAGEEKVSASLGDVAKYYFSETPLSIFEMTEEKPRIEMGHLYVTRGKAGDAVRIYTTDGQMVGTYPITANGTTDIDLTTLGKGLFIVRTAKASIKILNQ